MKNTSKKIPKYPVKELEKIHEAYAEVIRKLFLGKQDGKPRCIYNLMLERVAEKNFGISGLQLVQEALEELKANFKQLQVNSIGRILNAKRIGRHFAVLLRLIAKNVDLYILFDERQMKSMRIPLSGSYKEEFRKIIAGDEAATILLVKHPPEEAAKEIRKVTEESLYDMMCFWAGEQFQQKAVIHDNLRNYLQYATVRVLSTGNNPEVNTVTAAINKHLETHGGFEDTHWLRVVKGITQNEKQESLKQALSVCVPIVICIKILERVMPGILHAVGGVLDDLFGAIIPDVSQSMGDKRLPLKKRFQNAWPILKAGLVTLPAAFALGWFSAVLYNKSESVVVHMLSGVMFAFACSAGTLGTSIGAFKKAYTSINKMQQDKTYGYLAAHLSTVGKLKLAFKESIMDVPFRVGHTVIGVPFQILLGISAGAFGFFHSSIFIMVEGMAETVLGAVTAFVYPAGARLMRNMRLRRTKL